MLGQNTKAKNKNKDNSEQRRILKELEKDNKNNQ